MKTRLKIPLKVTKRSKLYSKTLKRRQKSAFRHIHPPDHSDLEEIDPSVEIKLPERSPPC
jgi:CRISPR/Cas system-associated endoribonuclease Cas2